MIYIIFTMAIIINIFNILLIANTKIGQSIKEKTLLLTCVFPTENVCIFIFHLFCVSQY